MRFSHQSWVERRPPVTNDDSEESRSVHGESAGRYPVVTRFRQFSLEKDEQRRQKKRDIQARRRAAKRGVHHERVDRAVIIQRDNRTCHICGRTELQDSEIHLDHVIPLAHGGPHTAENLKVACAPCNWSKGSTPPSDRP